MAKKKAQTHASASLVSFSLVAIAAAILSVILSNFAVAGASVLMTVGGVFFGYALCGALRNHRGGNRVIPIILLVVWFIVALSAYLLNLVS